MKDRRVKVYKIAESVGTLNEWVHNVKNCTWKSFMRGEYYVCWLLAKKRAGKDILTQCLSTFNRSLGDFFASICDMDPPLM